MSFKQNGRVASGSRLCASVLCTALLMGSGSVQAQSAAAKAAGGYRLSQAEMEEIASRTKLPHRIFYGRPSTGPDAAWFDAVKRGDLATVKAMVAKGQKLEAQDVGSLGQTALGWLPLLVTKTWWII